MAHEGAILQTIGHTPLVELKNLDSGGCRLFAKLENQNPTGSITDRIGLYIIEAAEREGRLKPGGTLIEATDRHTRTGLALRSEGGRVRAGGARRVRNSWCAGHN